MTKWPFAGLLFTIYLLLLFFVFFGCGCDEDSDGESGSEQGDSPQIDDDDAIDDDDDSSSQPSIYDDLTPSGPVLGKIIGIAAQMNSGPADEWKREFELNSLAEAGVRHLRNGFSWDLVEPANDQWTWENTDALRDLAVRKGFSWDARLAYTVDWASPDGSPSSIAPEDFADYAFHVAERYCDDIQRYEIWNEPNFYHFWEPEPDPEHYGRLLKAAYQAIKTACPEAEVLFGGLAPANFPQEWHSGTYPFFYQVVQYHSDICDYFDAMPIHPYTVFQEVRPEFSAQLSGMNYPDLPRQVDDIRSRLEAAGCPDKPVLFSEFGWPSTYIGQQRQAAYIVRAILLGAMKDISGFYLYTFWDKTGREPVTENHFGLYAYPESTDPEDQVPKQSFFALQTLGEILGETRYAGDLSEALALPTDVFAVAFLRRDETGLMIAAWNGRGGESPHTLTIPRHHESDTIQVFRIDGEQIIHSEEESITVTLSSDVIYIQFLFSNDFESLTI